MPWPVKMKPMTTDPLPASVPSLLWATLANSSARGNAGWRVVRFRNTPGRTLFAALEPDANRRVILLPLGDAKLPGRNQWPRCAGLEAVNAVLSGVAHIGVALKDGRFADVFDALAFDLARRVEASSSDAAAVAALLGQLARWQKFLSVSCDGLNETSQRGLWGEMHCLAYRLLPKLGSSVAVRAWKGAQRAHQDFQFPNGAIEVKTTTGKPPHTVRITSERQLDATSWPALFLHVLVLEAHEDAALTLPAIVERMRAELANEPAELEIFEASLMESGYFDVHSPRYAAVGYAVRSEHWFEVGAGFPCLVEQSLPPGIGDVSYGLSLAACTDFAVKTRRVLTIIAP
jgi:hypothetical protein